MALYEYRCQDCRLSFEQITSTGDPDQGKCPKCQGKNTHKLISKFAVAGRGDLRESTMHGCHDCDVALPDQGGTSHGHEGHDHD
jgi:putative FmdB family regulatory protein